MRLLQCIRFGVICGSYFGGDVLESGKLAAKIGQLGVSGASADISIEGDIATGSWKRNRCHGDVSFKRLS